METTQILEFYSPDEERDSSGKWTSAGWDAPGSPGLKDQTKIAVAARAAVKDWAKQFPGQAVSKRNEPFTGTTVFRSMQKDDLERVHKEGKITSSFGQDPKSFQQSRAGVWATDNPDTAADYLDPGKVIVAIHLEPGDGVRTDTSRIANSVLLPNGLPVDRILGVFDPRDLGTPGVTAAASTLEQLELTLRKALEDE